MPATQTPATRTRRWLGGYDLHLDGEAIGHVVRDHATGMWAGWTYAYGEPQQVGGGHAYRTMASAIAGVVRAAR